MKRLSEARTAKAKRRSQMSTAHIALLLVFSVCATAAFYAKASALYTLTASPRTTFHAQGPGGMKIVGQTAKGTLSDNDKLIIIKIPLATLKTGINLRDKHMREKYLEVQKYPYAELHVATASVRLPTTAELKTSAKGTLKLHGRSRAIDVPYRIKRDGENYQVSGLLRLNIRDYGITVPNYLGVTVKPDIEVRINMVVKNARPQLPSKPSSVPPQAP